MNEVMLQSLLMLLAGGVASSIGTALGLGYLSHQHAQERERWNRERDLLVGKLVSVQLRPSDAPRVDRHWDDRKEAQVATARKEGELDRIKRQIREGSRG